MAKSSRQECPQRDDLAKFLTGAFPPEEYNVIDQHLEGCAVCQASLETVVPASDTFVSNLQKISSAQPASQPPALDRMLAAVALIGRTPNPGTSIGSVAMPEIIRDYRLLEKLGQGAMGEVYKALHVHLNRIVALKLLPADRLSESAISRFQREMRAVGRLDHRHVVRAMDAGHHEGWRYLVMEYVAGRDLSQLVQQMGPLKVADACEIIRQAAQGLQHAHENQLVHRDIKPSNLIMDEEGNVKILDLGLALLNEPIAEGELTGTGHVMGTADYMAPEQVGDSHSVDIRADIYALGCTLYKLLIGEAPFATPQFKTMVQKMIAHANEPIPDILGRRPEIPRELASLIHRMLSKRPEDRPATPAELAEQIAPFCAGANLRALVGSVTNRTDSKRIREIGESGLKSDAPAAVSVHPTPRTGAGAERAGTGHAGTGHAGTGHAGTERGRVPPALRIAAIAMAGALVVFGIYLTLRTPHGEVIVEFADGVDPHDVKLEVLGNGELHLADAEQGWTIDVSQGRYDVKLAGGADRFAVDRETVTVTRNGTVRVRVALRPASEVKDAFVDSSAKPMPVERESSKKDPVVTLDHLDPQKIAKSEQFDWQPPELVAVIGEHRLRTWGELNKIAFHPNGEYFVGQVYPGYSVAYSNSKLDHCSGTSSDAFSNYPLMFQSFSPAGTKFANLATVAWLDLSAPPDQPRILRSAPIPSPSQPPLHGEHFAVAWLGDNILAIPTSERGVIEIWDLVEESPKLCHTLRFDSNEIMNNVVSSKDGRRLVVSDSISSDPRMLIGWDVDFSSARQPTFSQRFVLRSGEPIGRPHLSSDGDTLFVQLASGSVQVYDLSSAAPELIETIGGLGGAVAISSDGTLIAGGNGPIVYERQDGRFTRMVAFPGVISGIRAVMAISPDGSRLVAGAIDGRIHVYDLKSTPPAEVFPPSPESHPTKPRFSADGRYMTLDGHGCSTVWDLTSDTPVQRAVTSGIYDNPRTSMDENHVLLGGREVWDLGANPPHRLGILEAQIGRATLTGAGHIVNWTDRGVDWRSWEITRVGKFLLGAPFQQVELPDDHRLFAGFRPDINRMVTLTRQSNELRVWALDKTSEPLFVLTLPSNFGTAGLNSRLQFSNDGQQLAVWDDNRLHVFDLGESPPRDYEGQLPAGAPHDLAFSVSGRLVVLADGRGISVFDWVEGREIRRPHSRHSTGVAVHPDGHHIAVTNANGTTYFLRIPELDLATSGRNANRP